MAMEQQKPPTEEEDERDRHATNIFLLVAALIFVVVGVWLVNAMVDSRRTEECFESGRRNCNPISVPNRN
jgi:heme/copper-type cytochrome/quinol oxidase subunit 2